MKKKIVVLSMFLSMLSFSFESLNVYEDYNDERVDYQMFKTEKYKRPFDNYIFVKKGSNVRMGPDIEYEKAGSLGRNSRVKLLEEVVNEKDEKWYKVLIGEEKEGYIYSRLAIKRSYNIESAIKHSKKINEFIEKYKGNLKVLNKFVPLDTEANYTKDELGNTSNQSVLVYKDIKMTKHYNLQDRTIVSIVGKTDKFYIIASPFYEGVLYYPKKNIGYLKNLNLNEINKFIYINKKDQNQISFEMREGKYYPVAISDVTTGANSKFGFETPTGYFLVDITKPFMYYIDYEDEEQKIVGEAKYAIRFSGGAYLHGIPTTYEPKETLYARKKMTESVLGTYGRSKKCVRNYDEVVKILYDWISYKHINKFKHRTPKEPVFVIVE